MVVQPIQSCRAIISRTRSCSHMAEARPTRPPTAASRMLPQRQPRSSAGSARTVAGNCAASVAIAGGGSGVSTTSTSSSRKEVGLRGFVM